MNTMTRRGGLLVAVGSAATILLPAAPARAQQQQPSSDWLETIRQHHRLIARGFEVLFEPNNEPFERFNLQLRNLDQLLTAHSLAEETVIYPALAIAGMTAEAEQLYKDEAHVKIALARLELVAPRAQGRQDWVEPARQLRESVLRHATQDEEGRIFPELQRRLEPARQRALAVAYVREFGRILPVGQRNRGTTPNR